LILSKKVFDLILRSSLQPLDPGLAFNEVQYLQGFQVLDAVNGVSPFSAKRENTAGPQDAEMLGYVGLLEVQLFADVGHTTALLIEKLKDPNPGGVSQSLQIFSLYSLFLIHFPVS